MNQGGPSTTLEKLNRLLPVCEGTQNPPPQGESLGRIVNTYFELTEGSAVRKTPMVREDWSIWFDKLLEFDERSILQDSGQSFAADAKAHAESKFEKYRIVQGRLFESSFNKVIKQLEQQPRS